MSTAAAPAALPRGVVRVRLGRHTIDIPTLGVLAQPGSLIGTAFAPTWRRAPPSSSAATDEVDGAVDLTGTVPPLRPSLVTSVLAYYDTGELHVPPDCGAYEAYRCWNALHLSPPAPPLLPAEEVDDLAALLFTFFGAFLEHHRADLRLLCCGELPSTAVHVILPLWSVSHQRTLLAALVRARESSSYCEAEEEDGLANALPPRQRGFASFANAQDTLARLCPLDPIAPAASSAARSNVALALPSSIDDACAEAETWLVRARITSALARSSWATHLFLRALAEEGLEAKVGKVTATKDANGTFAYGHLGGTVRLAWFPWISPHGDGWQVSGGEALAVEITPHWGVDIAD